MICIYLYVICYIVICNYVSFRFRLTASTKHLVMCFILFYTHLKNCGSTPLNLKTHRNITSVFKRLLQSFSLDNNNDRKFRGSFLRLKSPRISLKPYCLLILFFLPVTSYHYSYLFISIHIYSYLFISIHIYSYLFISIHIYSYLFISIHIYSYNR